MNLRFTIFALLILLFASSCIDEIKLNIDTDQRRIAITGLIADRMDIYTIELDYSAVIGVGNDNVLDPITGATVRVFDDAGNVFEFVESEEDPGIYQKEMQGEIGRAYYTEIKLPDGKVIQSQPATMLAAPPIDSVQAYVDEEIMVSGSGNIFRDSRVVVEVSTSFTEDNRPFLRWRADGEYEFQENYPEVLSPRYCYVKNKVDLNKLKVFDTRTLAGNRIIGEQFLSTPLDFRFAFNYCFHVFQYAMPEIEYKYWASVGDIINIDGSLFDPPPGTVRGNLFNIADEEEVIVGYFSVSGVQTKRFFANPRSIGVTYVEPKCRIRFNRTLPPECFDCRIIIGSSLIKPDYWIP